MEIRRGEGVQVCPICGKTAAEQPHWVSCPKEGQAVCMKHCYKECIHHKDARCGYKR